MAENEKRLIDVEQAKRATYEEVFWTESEQAAVRHFLAKIPKVDAAEVVHGRWELHGNDDDCGCSYFCSNCHESYDEDWFYVHGQHRHWIYCPNCGAKMDGGVKNA